MNEELEALKMIRATIDERYEETAEEYYEIVKQALKRNEPMKVKTVKSKHPNKPKNYHKCPNCDDEFFFKLTTMKYCMKCGQKLDWESE